jgi:nicotinamidase-related amidase
MENTCLIVIDIQNDYFEGGRNPLVNSYNAAVKAKLLLDKFREKNLPVVLIQHISTRAGSSFFLPNTTGADFHELVTPVDTDKIIVKNFPNSFRNTGLLDYLKSINAQKLIICGMMTHMCVNSTTRAAKDLGFECTVISDACATKALEFNGEKVDAKNVHYSFLAAMGYFDANITEAEKFLTTID